MGGAPLTCLEGVGGVGGALTVVRYGDHADRVHLTTFERGDLAAGGGRRAVDGRADATDGRRSVRVGPEYQIPGYCRHAAGAAVVRGDCRHRVDCCKRCVNR